ncbi:bifunctional YncE family protein/alkaline phosphatase family protein [Actinomadura chibensis]|uniref:bifunctional YncE family protein/alkaline phosphatase family protein n=1 Tax=Actinomadura chibensis TaxID=392828 RepID=UPI000AA6EE4B|nr:bifunctional YncE family protein/alkaline phosphatase family protein [Actinomadura chibensis]
MRLRSRRAIAAAAALVVLSGGAAYAGTRKHAGPQGDGTGVTPVGHLVPPAGTQVTLGLLPLASALSPDGSRLLVVNAGQGVQSLQVVDTSSGAVAQTIGYKSPQALYAGVAWSPDGGHAYASAGGNNKIRVYDAAGGTLTEKASIALPTTNPDGQKVNMFPAGLAVTPDGKRLLVADQQADALSVVDLATGKAETTAVGHRPYGVALGKDGKTAYVANQGAASVSVVDVSGTAPTVVGNVPTGTHPNKVSLSADGSRAFVTAGDGDEADVVDTARNKVVQKIDLSPYNGAPIGSNPVASAPSPDGRLLYVANSGNNDVAVVDLRRGRVTGMIPTGWYPTSVHVLGDRLLVVNAKGLGAGPNDGPGKPDPHGGGTPDKYIGSMIKGTLSLIDRPSDPGRLRAWSRQVVRNNGFDERDRVRGGRGDGGHVVPLHPGAKTPIKHVIYVVRENRTYDQEFGSIGKGGGDPGLNLFGDESAPNARELSRRFVTFDNFYADAEVSAQGWNWVVGSNSNPYSEQVWPANYSSRNAPYPSENGTPEIAPNSDPKDAYIWQRLKKAGVPFRNYGFYVQHDAQGRASAEDPVLNAATDPEFHGYDLACPDSPNSFTPLSKTCGTPRISRWLTEFRAFEKSGKLPSVEFVRLPNDHTAGTKAGSPTPRAYVADNDYALGLLVDAVSKSKFWKDTAIFVTEDDAQNGPDHIDAHRTLALVISPYTQTGRVDSTFYSTVSMVRTIQLISGIRPLTQFDAYATPMTAAFTSRPNTRPYDAVVPQWPRTETNSASAPLAAVSAQQQLGKEDQIDERTFNQAIWQSVRGKGAEMPEPRHRLPGAPAVEHDDDDDD